eukprot:PhF_6_TR34575/c0_g2_i2/m.50362
MMLSEKARALVTVMDVGSKRSSPFTSTIPLTLRTILDWMPHKDDLVDLASGDFRQIINMIRHLESVENILGFESQINVLRTVDKGGNTVLTWAAKSGHNLYISKLLSIDPSMTKLVDKCGGSA